MKMNFILLFFAALMISCGDDNTMSMTDIEGTNEMEEPTIDAPNILGMDYTRSLVSADETYTAIKSALESNPNIGIIAEVDHQTNAASVDQMLNPTKIIFFGNPNLGTPLMQKNQLAGLDLPQKILVYQNQQNEVYAGFNNVSYIANRHGLEGTATLPMIQGALTNFSTSASQSTIVAAENSAAQLKEGIITKTVNGSCDEAYSRLRAAIENNAALKVIAELDHQANAAKVDLSLNPTRLIIFGNPNLGTPLMQNSQTTALDLPQKMLVWTDDNGVGYVSYNDPAFLMKRHGISENETVLATITGALDKLSDAAVGAP